MADTPEQALVREAIREFVDGEAPLEQVDAWDEAHAYPAAFYKKLAELGYVGITFNADPDAEGAVDAMLQGMVVAEELGTRGLDLGTGYSLIEFLGTNIARHGTPEQRERYLPAAAAGDLRFSIAMTEPGAGSDAAGIRLAAKRVDGGWVLNGQKTFITGAGQPDTILHVTAVTDKDAGRHRGMTIFLTPHDAPGIEIVRLRTIGKHLLGTNEVFFNDVFVPEDGVLGEVDQGWGVLGSGLSLERLFGCAMYTGCHRTVWELARDYANERHQFGQAIGSFQAVAHPIADIYADYEASRALTYRAAGMIAAGEEAAQALAVAKLFCSEALQRATTVAMQVHGGYGYTLEYSIQRLWREARIATVSAGTSEIQRTIISRGLGLGRKRAPSSSAH